MNLNQYSMVLKVSTYCKQFKSQEVMKGYLSLWVSIADRLKVWNLLVFSLVDYVVSFQVSAYGSLVSSMMCCGGFESSVDGV